MMSWIGPEYSSTLFVSHFKPDANDTDFPGTEKDYTSNRLESYLC